MSCGLFCVLLTLTLVFLVVWTVVDPMYWKRDFVFESDDRLETYGSCWLGKTKVSTAMLGCLILLAFACVIMACVAAWNGREVSIEYSESRYVGIIMLGLLQVFLLGIPYIILVKDNPQVAYFVKSTTVFLLTASILLLMFVPKIIFLREELMEKEANPSGQSPSTSDSTKSCRYALNVVGRNQVVALKSSLAVGWGNAVGKGSSNYSNEKKIPGGSVIDLRGKKCGSPAGITREQMDNLTIKLRHLGTIDDTTDLRSIIESSGIPVADNPSLQHSENHWMKSISETKNEQDDDGSND
mmetsp:Transcript_10094/g.21145  ORF Transcript_10094/g.21145 Transcript_10094/m.21145 type:complete len:298 (+) Transcript_10094:1-894(+)